MIQIGTNFEIERDKYQWILVEWRDGINPKTKESTRSPHKTYHATLEQVAGVVVDRGCEDCESLQEMVAIMADVKSILVTKLEAAS